jgi:hypothetical protein
MPTYLFKNMSTGETFEEFMSITAREEYLVNNPDLIQLVNSAPALGDSVRLGLRKPDDGFRDVLKEIKNKHSGGLSASTINTF